MFGYIITNPKLLTEAQLQHYKACYCGLCHALSSRHGFPCRATLNYDMTFLVLLLTALKDEDTPCASRSCPKHPLKKQDCWQNSITDYAADMNVLLAYYQQLDAWEDDRSASALTVSKLLKNKALAVKEGYPRQAKAITESLALLSDAEKRNDNNPDVPANCFGRLMGEIFRFGGVEEDKLYAFGEALGRFIYLMDAACDLKKDIRKERYNPLVFIPSDMHKALLDTLLAECIARFEALPILRDKEIMENILYSGVWTHYLSVWPSKGGNAQ